MALIQLLIELPILLNHLEQWWEDRKRKKAEKARRETPAEFAARYGERCRGDECDGTHGC